MIKTKSTFKQLHEANEEIKSLKAINEQLEIDANYGNMLLVECENLKSEYVVLEEKFKRLQDNIIVYQSEAEAMKNALFIRNGIITSQDKKLEWFEKNNKEYIMEFAIWLQQHVYNKIMISDLELYYERFIKEL